MNKKMKKLIATLLLGMTLCGSVLTAQAAVLGCGHPSTITTTTHYNVTYTHTYTANSVEYVYTITVPHTKFIVTCSNCGTVLQTNDIAGTPTHSLNH